MKKFTQLLLLLVIMLILLSLNIHAKTGRLLVTQSVPRFFIETHEKNLGKNLNPLVLKRKMVQLFLDNGYTVVYKKANANYIIEVYTNTKKLKKDGRKRYSVLFGKIRVLNSYEQLIFEKPIEGITGSQLNYIDAGLDAYNNLSIYMNRNFLPNLKDEIKGDKR